MTDDQILEVVQAHKDGKPIQIRKMGWHHGFRDGTWYDCENPQWDFDTCDYRVKPEHREWWLSRNLVAYETRDAARDVGHPIIHVREVIES